jgi:hypothetical protein
VECRTPLATFRHLFLTPARKCEPTKNLGGKKKMGAMKKKLEQKKN